MITALDNVMTLCDSLSDDQHHQVLVLDELYPWQDEDWSNMKIFNNVDLVFLSKPSPDGYVVTPPAGPGVRSYLLQHTYRQSRHTLMAFKYLVTHAGYNDLRWSAGIVSDDDRSPQGGETVWIECTEEVEQVTVLETVKKMMPGGKNITALYYGNYDRQAEEYCLANTIHYARGLTIFGSESEVILYYIV